MFPQVLGVCPPGGPRSVYRGPNLAVPALVGMLDLPSPARDHTCRMRTSHNTQPRSPPTTLLGDRAPARGLGGALKGSCPPAPQSRLRGERTPALISVSDWIRQTCVTRSDPPCPPLSCFQGQFPPYTIISNCRFATPACFPAIIFTSFWPISLKVSFFILGPCATGTFAYYPASLLHGV